MGDHLGFRVRKDARFREWLPHCERYPGDVADGVDAGDAGFERATVGGHPAALGEEPGIAYDRRRPVRRHVQEQVEVSRGPMGEYQAARRHIDPRHLVLRVVRDALRLDDLAHAGGQLRAGHQHWAGLRRIEVDPHAVPNSAATECACDQHRRFVRRCRALVRGRRGEHGDPATRQRRQLVVEGSRPAQRIQIVTAVGEAGNRLRCQIGAERHDHRVAYKVLPRDAHRARLGVKLLDGAYADLDAFSDEHRERPLDRFRRSVADRDPEQRRLEERLAFAVDEHHPMSRGEQLAKTIGGDEAADAATEDEYCLVVTHEPAPA